MKDHGAALEAALDKGRIAEGSRDHVFAIFDEQLRRDHDPEAALGAALDIIAVDGSHYRSMWDEFWRAQARYDRTFQGRLVSQVERLKAKIGLNDATIIH